MFTLHLIMFTHYMFPSHNVFRISLHQPKKQQPISGVNTVMVIRACLECSLLWFQASFIALRQKIWLALCPDNVSEWSQMEII